MKCLVSAQGVICLASFKIDMGEVGVFMRKGRLRDLYEDGRTMRDEAPEISANDAVPRRSGFQVKLYFSHKERLEMVYLFAIFVTRDS